MKSGFATLQELNVPAGQETAIYFGRNVPAAVAALYAPGKVIACMLFRRFYNAEYVYLALVVPTVGTEFVALGGMESVAQTIAESQRWQPTGGDIRTIFRAQSFILGSMKWQPAIYTPGPSPTVTPDWTIRDIGSASDVSVPRGQRAYYTFQANTGAIGTTPTLVIQQSFTFRNNRALRLELFGNGQSSASTNVLVISVNVNYGAGDVALWRPGAFGPSGSAQPYGTTAFTHVVNNTGADKTGTINVYVNADAGTVNWLGSANAPHGLSIVDAGDKADFANAIALP